LCSSLSNPAAHLYIVSDGGNREKVGSYGFVIADAESEERLWQASGRAQGFDMSSYRAEAQGMLAGLHFLRMFIWFHCNAKAACKLTHFCDNQSLVIETAWNRTWAEPSDSLKPEYDLLAAITRERELLQTYAHKYQRNRWVKGHQEDVTPYHQLTFESKLNIEADKLATEAIDTVERKNRLLKVTGNKYCRAFLLNGGDRQTRDETNTLQTGSARLLHTTACNRQNCTTGDKLGGYQNV
jgi:ribonuclease HI